MFTHSHNSIKGLSDHGDCVQLIDYTWLHLINGSNYAKIPGKEQLVIKMIDNMEKHQAARRRRGGRKKEDLEVERRDVLRAQARYGISEDGHSTAAKEASKGEMVTGVKARRAESAKERKQSFRQ